MANGTMKLNRLRARMMSQSFPANSMHIQVSADIQVGETFVCWTGFASDGWVGPIYAAYPNAATTEVWRADTKTESVVRSFKAVYMYYTD